MKLDTGEMRLCFRCGAPGEAVEVTRDDVVVAMGALCDECFGNSFQESQRLRDEFESLLEAGLSRPAANARMIDKIEGRGGRA